MVRKRLSEWYVSGSTWQWFVALAVKLLVELSAVIFFAGILTVVAFVVFPIEAIEQYVGVDERGVVWFAFTVGLANYLVCSYINDQVE